TISSKRWRRSSGITPDPPAHLGSWPRCRGSSVWGGDQVSGRNGRYAGPPLEIDLTDKSGIWRAQYLESPDVNDAVERRREARVGQAGHDDAVAAAAEQQPPGGKGHDRRLPLPQGRERQTLPVEPGRPNAP